MAKGQMATDGFYPDANGIQIPRANTLLGGSQSEGHRVGWAVSKTPGTGAAYILQTRVQGNWLNVTGASLSGNGSAATGARVNTVYGDAVRLSAANGTSPGTTTNTPFYELLAYPVVEDGNARHGQALTLE